MTTVLGKSCGKASHPLAKEDDRGGTENDYYLIGLPSWKKDLILRRKQTEMVRSESSHLAAGAAVTSTRFSSEHHDESRDPQFANPVSVTGTEIAASVDANNGDDLHYEPGFVSKLRLKWSKLSATPADDSSPASAERRAAEPGAHVATSREHRIASPASSSRRRSSGTRDLEEIVIIEKGVASPQPGGRVAVGGPNIPKPHLAPNERTNRKNEESVTAATQAKQRNQSRRESAEKLFIASVRARAATAAGTPESTTVEAPPGVLRTDPKTQLAKDATSQGSASQAIFHTDDRYAAPGTAARHAAAAPVKASAAVSATTVRATSDDRSGDFVRPPLRETVPERGTGKRLLDTRTEAGFQRKVPDHELRESKVPTFVNANVVVGRGSFRKSEPPKIRPNVSFNDLRLTDTYEYSPEGVLMVEMARDAGGVYYDDPLLRLQTTGHCEDEDDSDLQAALNSPLSSRVAAAARSGNLGSYRASVAGSYSFGQHLARQDDGGWQPAAQQAASVAPDSDARTGGVDATEHGEAPVFSANDAGDLLF